ncbi:hypothetical protein GDO86_002525, partial [Hymenochirus boettgeri]
KTLKSDIIQFVTFSLKQTPGSLQTLQSLVYLTELPEMSAGQISLLWSDLLSSIFTSFWNSTITTDPDYWSSWSNDFSPEDKKIVRSLMEPSVKGPAILSRAVFSKCFCEVLTSSSKAIPWDVTGFPVLISSRVSVGEWTERLQQLKEMSAILWSNMSVSSIASFRNTDSRLQGLILYHHFVALKDIVPQNIQEEFLQYCDHLPTKDLSAYHYIQDILRDWMNQDKLPTDVLKLWLTCLQQFYAEVDGTIQVSDSAHRGSLWVNLGLLQIHIWQPQTLFDPAVKREYKLKYAQDELQQLENEWMARNWSYSLLMGKELKDETLLKHTHPHVQTLLLRIQKLKNRIVELSKKQAYRPKSPTYGILHSDVQNYINSIAKISSVQDLASRLLKVLTGKTSKSRQTLQNLLSEEATWQQSHHLYRRRLSEEYSLYPDLISPLNAAILQMQHGMRLIASEVYGTMNSSLLSSSKIASLLMSLLVFPSVSESFPTYLSNADNLCSVNSIDILKSLKRLSQKYPSSEGPGVRDISCCLTKEQLLVNSLLYLRSHVLSKGEMDQKSLKLFRHICQALINDWDKQESTKRECEKQESSLYKYRSKTHNIDLAEEEDEREFRKRYPVYDKDFADIITKPTLETYMESMDPEDQEDAHVPVLSQSTMQAVIDIHKQLVLSTARSLWYHNNPPPHQIKHYLSAFLSSYQTSAALIEQLYPLIGSELNDHLLGSQMLAATLLQNTVSSNTATSLILPHEGPYVFYQHPNIQEVQKCQEVLRCFRNSVNSLLGHWTEHPALVQIVVVIERIQGFPLSSPLSKILNGLEILLTKSQDWEENASNELSLRKHLEEITQLIIQWRKLELNCWSLGLDNCMERHVQKAMSHWFSLYQLVEKYMQEEQDQESSDGLRIETLTKTLQAFIESSSVGEFHSRLDLLLVFHCHVLLTPQAPRKDSLCSVLWNLYHYYKQFSPSILAKITELRNPLEKELKVSKFTKMQK